MLAGGRSRRMGEDKRWLRLFPESRTFLERAVAVGRLVADDVVVVGSVEQLPPSLAVDAIPDEWPGEGPLGALATASVAVGSGRVVVVAIDYPMLQVDVVRRLVECTERSEAVIALADEDGRQRRHPLVGCYDAAICASIASALFATGERSVRSLLDRLDLATVPFTSVVDTLSLTNVNTPGELAALRSAVVEQDLRATRGPRSAVGDPDAKPYTHGSRPARFGDFR